MSLGSLTGPERTNSAWGETQIIPKGGQAARLLGFPGELHPTKPLHHWVQTGNARDVKSPGRSCHHAPLYMYVCMGLDAYKHQDFIVLKKNALTPKKTKQLLEEAP